MCLLDGLGVGGSPSLFIHLAKWLLVSYFITGKN
jgi:hypothetical protein